MSDSSELTPIPEDQFPRAIAKRVNLLTDALFGAWEVAVNEDLSARGKVERSNGRTVIKVPRSGRPGAVAQPVDNWTVFFRNNSTTDTPNWQAGVYLQSPVQQTEDIYSLAYPSGLLNVNNPLKATSGWHNVSNNTLLWDEISFDPASNPTAPFTIVAHSIGVGSLPAGGVAEYADISMSGPPVYAQTVLRIPVVSVGFDNNRPYGKVIYTKNVPRLIQGIFTANKSDGSDPRDISGVFYWK